MAHNVNKMSFYQPKKTKYVETYGKPRHTLKQKIARYNSKRSSNTKYRLTHDYDY